VKRNPYREELELAQRQRKKLQTIVNKLETLSSEWTDLHGGLEADFSLLVDAVEPQLTVMDEQIAEWRDSLGEKENCEEPL
jgi:hypothetical protein